MHGGDNRIGDALVPLAGLEERWPGRKQEISELAGLIGEVGGAWGRGRGGGGV